MLGRVVGSVGQLNANVQRRATPRRRIEHGGDLVPADRSVAQRGLETIPADDQHHFSAVELDVHDRAADAPATDDEGGHDLGQPKHDAGDDDAEDVGGAVLHVVGTEPQTQGRRSQEPQVNEGVQPGFPKIHVDRHCRTQYRMGQRGRYDPSSKAQGASMRTAPRRVEEVPATAYRQS